MEQVLAQLAVKILFDDSTGFNEIRWTTILQGKQKSWMMMMSWSLTTHQPFWVISVIKVR